MNVSSAKTNMSRFLCLCAAFAAMTGCATKAPEDPKLSAIAAWRPAASAAVDAGQLSQSQYLQQLYEIVSAPPVDRSDVIWMRILAQDIDTSEKLERGSISESEAVTQMRFSEVRYQDEIDAYMRSLMPAQASCVTWQGFTQCRSH